MYHIIIVDSVLAKKIDAHPKVRTPHSRSARLLGHIRYTSSCVPQVFFVDGHHFLQCVHHYNVFNTCMSYMCMNTNHN